MIIQIILDPIFSFINFIIDFIPSIEDDMVLGGLNGVVAIMNVLNIGFYIFPASMFFIVVANVIFWSTVQITWAMVEWVYKKIPGVN